MDRARDLLEAVPCNAALLLHNGCTEDEAIDYMVTYMQGAHINLKEWAIEGTFSEKHVFTYYYGNQLMQC